MTARPPREADARLQGFAAQRVAADPAVSAWVAANAGAGKTRVLTDRVLRLLLAGARPASILCLTFTKAAAAEMANRLHNRLSAWTMMAEEGLQAALQPLLGHPADDATCRRARRLFAATLEAPGGLRIQTIHAFCESVLKRFPVEAGVPPHFAIADDPTAREMVATAIARVLAAAPGDPELARALALLADRVDETGFDRAIQDLVGNRRLLRRVLHPGGTEGALAALQSCLAIAGDVTEAALRTQFVEELPANAMLAAAEVLAQGGKRDQEQAARIRAFLAPGDAAGQPAGLEEGWLPCFLKKDLAARADSTLASKKVLELAPHLLDTLLAEQARCLALLDRLRAMAVAEASAAMLHLGAEILSLYELEKSRRAALDYDDLILTVRDLLAQPGRAPWVLYKLDGGIDHVLVDEAQDTSLEQWEIVTALTGEFFAGEGQRADAAPPRTLFAVGDEKQSIFGFQGAAPAAFHHMRGRLAGLAEDGRRPWRDVDLALSFRTVPLLLRAVDAVFARPEAQDGVAAGAVLHAPFRVGEGGRVELWPPATATQAAEDAEPWDAPLDYVAADSPPALLAGRIAGTIAGWLADGETLDAAGRPIAPGDIMILVRRRDALFRQIVAACKAAGLPVAGEDRLKLGDSLAVQDLLAVARFCLLPEDDLTLAAVLRGPFCDIDEDSLMALCLPGDGRPGARQSWGGQSWGGALWRHLRGAAAERTDWQAARDFLSAAMAVADFVTPYAFFAGLLERGGMARLQARLGEQAREPVEELLNLALAYGRGTAESLQGFLAWFEAGGAEIKRDLEQAGGEIRVLTVHAAKGLEAPVVFLPDTTGRPDGRFDPPVLWPEGPPPALLWAPRAAEDDGVTGETRERHRQAQLAEYRRLLYVAMTRARDRLYVCGWENRRRPAGCWYDLIADGLADLPDAVEIALPWGENGWRWQQAQTAPPTGEAGDRPLPDRAMAPALPDWARLPAPEEPEPPRPLAPSRPAEPPPAISPRTPRGRAALARGRLIHSLLQVLPELPPAERHAAGEALLRRAAPDLAQDAISRLLAEAIAILDEPRFAAAFGPQSRAEVALAGRAGAAILSGRIDRLAVSEARVLVIDYKTQEAPPASAAQTPLQHLQQLALYRDLLRRIYPDRPVDCAILWTAGPHLMPLPSDLLDRALAGPPET